MCFILVEVSELRWLRYKLLGRPLEIELLTFIDRRFSRHLPIQPDYRGRQVDAINNEKVKVCWKENDGLDAVYLIKN